NGTSTTLELDKGTWRISAIGWDGGEMAPARHFAGKAYCGSISKSLVNDTETIQLNVSQEGCTKDLFSAGHVDTAASPSTLKNLGRNITCNSFFKAKPSPTDTLSGMLIDGSTEDNYCENLDNDLRG